MPGRSRVIWNYAALKRIVNTPHGGTYRLLEQKAILIENQAKINASVSDGVPPTRRSHGPGLRRVTGVGVGSIAHEMGTDSGGVYARVGTNVFYMAIQELQGTYTWLVPALKAYSK